MKKNVILACFICTLAPSSAHADYSTRICRIIDISEAPKWIRNGRWPLKPVKVRECKTPGLQDQRYSIISSAWRASKNVCRRYEILVVPRKTDGRIEYMARMNGACPDAAASAYVQAENITPEEFNSIVNIINSITNYNNKLFNNISSKRRASHDFKSFIKDVNSKNNFTLDRITLHNSFLNIKNDYYVLVVNKKKTASFYIIIRKYWFFPMYIADIKNVYI